MKMRKVISVLLVAVMLIGLVPMVPVSFAAGSGDLTFRLNSGGQSYYISECKTSASGELVIPGTYKGKPVTRIDSYAFYNCKKLTSITIPDSVTTIDKSAFSDCSGLTSIIIPDSVTSIGEYVFYECSKLANVTIPDSVKSMGKKVFYNTPWYNNKPNGLVYAGKIAYKYKGNMPANTSIELLDGTKGIAGDAFFFAWNLISITIPDSVTNIGDLAFGMTDIGSVTIPKSVTSIGERAFTGCDYLAAINVSDENPVYSSVDGVMFNKNKTNLIVYPAGKPDKSYSVPDSVTSISSEAFDGCTELTSVTIADSVKSIGDSAFDGCTGLTSIELPDYITSISSWMFYGCTSLTSITIPYSVTSINYCAFGECTGLRGITILNPGTSIADDVFFMCDSRPIMYVVHGSSAEAYAIEQGISYRTIGNNLAFTLNNAGQSYYVSDCFTLAYGEIVIPENYEGLPVTGIGASAFSNCKELTGITIPDSVTSIDDNAFYGCTALTAINVHDGNAVYSSADGILYNISKSKLIKYPARKPDTSYTVPASVTSIGEDALFGCSALSSIDVSEGNTVYYSADGVLYNVSKSELIKYPARKPGTSYTVPDSVTDIGANAFFGCTGLKGVTIPESVTSIDDNAFFGCNSSLVMYVIHDSVAEAYAIERSIGYLTIGNNLSFTLNGDGQSYYVSGCLATAYGAIVVPEMYNGKPVTSIGDSVFSGLSGITSVTIQDSVTSIGASAFSGCTGLSSVTIPDYVMSIGASAFSGCTGLLSITIPVGVTSIGADAFSGCSSLVMYVIHYTVAEAYAIEHGISYMTIGNNLSFTLNDGGQSYYVSSCFGKAYGAIVVPEMYNEKPITSIGNSAFYGCKGLTSVTIPDSVTSIGNSAFYGCKGLTSVTIPDFVVSIGNNAFYGCTDLMNIIIPNSVKSMGADMFINTAWYNSLPDGVVYAGRAAYSYKGTMPENESIVITDGTRRIINNAFSDCTALASVIIPDSVTSIENGAFSGCTGLISVIIPDSVTSIGNSAFNNCTGLTSITFSDSVTSIDLDAFSGCNSLVMYVIHDSFAEGYAIEQGISYLTTGNNLIFSLNDDGQSYYVSNCLTTAYGEVIIPEVYNEKPVTGMREAVFSGLEYLTSVTIPSSITSISDYAFAYSSNLASITIPDSVTSVGTDAFYGTSWYNNQPDGLVYAGKAVYRYKGEMPENESIELENGTKSIAASAFSNCMGLKNITIPNSVTSIGDCAFEYCMNLESITIPDFVTSIGRRTFYYCSGLTSITIPDSVVSIGDSAFHYCERLADITVPDSVTSLGTNVFEGTAWLYNQSDGLVYAGKVAYAYKGSVQGETSVVLADGTKGIAGSAFLYCAALTSITIPDSVTSIGASAFSDCASLTGIKIPYGVTHIGSWTFGNCMNLRSITIPESVTSISDAAFYSCVGLTAITIPESVESIDDYAFGSCSENLTIYCYENSAAQAFASANSYLFEFVRICPASGETAVIGQDLLIPTAKEGESALANIVTAVDGYSAQGTPSYGSLYGTGSAVNVYDSSNNLVSTYTVAVEGDLDGSGYVDALDCMYAELASAGHYTLSDTEDPTGAYRAANDVNSDGSYDSTDFEVIMSKSLK